MKKEVKNWKTSVQPEVDVLISCQGEDGKPNALAVAYACNCSYDPPMVMVGVVPSRHSHKLIKETGEFVVNIPSEAQRELYTFMGSNSGRDMNKFEEFGVAWEPGKKVSAPILTDCPLNIECKVVDSIMTGSHEMFVGEIVGIQANEEMVNDQGEIVKKMFTPMDFR